MLLFLHQHCPAESNKDKSRAAQHPDGPVELTGLDQAAGVGDGHNAFADVVGGDIALGNVGFNDLPVAVGVQVFP